MYSDDDPTLMVQPPSANDQQHRLREVMFYLNLSEQEKDAFCERFGVRLLTSYGMTETIVGIIGDVLAINDAGRRLVGWGFATKRRSATITIARSRLVRSVKSALKAYLGKPSSRVLSQPTSHCESAGSRWLAAYRRYRIPRRRGLFLFRRSPLQYDKRGGENVSCVELENIIAAHPKIQDIVVVGIKDSIRDEAIKAFVVLNEGETLSEEEFFRFCEQNMAKFKVPSYLEIRKDLPRNCSGKIIRKNLK
ncbi:crotonobetaine/carnitine-CoA ligase [Escherichia coli]|uniref:Crotonobetaine/carnitine-CoA ligase n=1 Tax=Escherichia coli TaxID=562 RepID=A0A2X1Q2V2_ECOLX|nr:crotonobetaine/carnitine-CoA ligase [Escherichia coli]